MIHRTAAFAAFAVSLAGAGSPFELEDVLSAPYPTELVSAAASERLAWTENERGQRSLWTAAAPDFEARRLVLYPDDDGQELGGLALTPDGEVLVYVRGGAPNTAGDIPNPASLADGVERAIWAVRTSGGDPWRLAEGAGPVVTPDGAAVLFARGGELFEVRIEPSLGGEPEPEALFAARGGVSDVTPSPEGGRIAFVSLRGDHAFVGVFHRDTSRIVWMSPDFDRDSAPVWSPDGARLAYLRVAGALMGERIHYNDEVPFALRVGDPATGESREVWASPGADGGFVRYYASPLLAWAGDRLVFASEAGGWLHYWSVPAAGGEAVELTPGEGIAEWAVVTGEGASLVFGGNFEDREARHLFRVPAAGGPRERLTSGAVVDAEPVRVGAGLAFRRSTAHEPPAVSRLAGDGTAVERISRPLPDRFPRELVEPEVVRLTAGDGFESHAVVFVPKGVSRVPRPAAVFLHGGPMRQMLPAFHYSSYYAGAYAFNQYLASRGYVVLALNFRSGIGYGRGFRAAPNQGPRGAAEYADLVAAAQYLRGRDDVDPDRIGLWGGSYGGYMTAMGLARDSHLFAAGVDLHGVHDWSWRGERFHLPGGFWGLHAEDSALARRSSPVFDVDSWSSPVLMVHGDDDRNVDFIQTTDLVQRLREKGVHVESLVFPDEVHGFLRYASWLEAFRRAAEFFDRFLGKPGS